MTPEGNIGSSWDRVAAELRACREAQQQAWGDIDNTTLGRFLAGEVSPDEQHQIENALATLPELRKLTDLVRDVLGETESALPPPSVASGPATLPFPQPRPQTLLPAPESASPMGGSWRERKHGESASRFRQYALLATAACVLLALGVALPPTSPSPNTSANSSIAFYRPVAERVPPLDTDRAVAMVDVTNESLARQYISNWTRQARVYQEQGDLARAEPALAQARLLCTKTLGPDAPETVRTRKSLAGMYVAALDAPPTLGHTFARKESPLPRSAALEMKGIEAKRRDKPMLMATNPTRADATNSPLRSASSYGSATAPRPMLTAPAANAARPPQRPQALTPEQRSAAALRLRITRQKQYEIRNCVVPVLTQGLRESKDGSERQRLARALGQLGPAASDAVPALIDAYRRSRDASERSVFVAVLGQIGSSARLAAPLLVEALHSDDTDLRRSAARALVRLGPAAHGCCKDLARQTSRDPLIVDLLQRIDGPEGRSGIDDAAGCFSVESIQQARDAVLHLAKTARLAVRIETFADAVALKRKTDMLREETRPKGVCVCIDKDPAEVQVFVSEEQAKQGLSDLALRRALEPHLREHDFNGALHAAIRFLEEFEKNQTRK